MRYVSFEDFHNSISSQLGAVIYAIEIPHCMLHL